MWFELQDVLDHYISIYLWKCPKRHDFHMNYVLVPADKAANNVVVVWRLYYINTLKRELVDTNAYKLQPSLSERVIVDGHGCHTALHFGVKAKENQDKVPTLYWLPKLHKKPYEGCSNMNASSFITFFTYMLRQNVIPFWKELFVAFKVAPNIKKNSLYFSSYRGLYKGHSCILAFFLKQKVLILVHMRI